MNSLKLAVQIENVEAGYGDIVALSSVNLQIAVGSFTGIIGPNGGGKTTLLKIILGLLKPRSGKVSIFGQDPHVSRRLIGYVPQADHVNRNFPISVREVILQGRLAGKSLFCHRFKTIDHEKVQWCLQKLDLQELAQRQVGQLSRGQWQRVMIARALAVEPQLLLLDEPVTGLDSHASSLVYELLKELNREMTIIMVTHDTMAISSYVDDIACINHSLYYHGETKIDADLVMQLYGCPVELIAHGVPHRVLEEHGGQ